MTGKRLLVTGAGGLLGSAVVRFAHAKGFTVIPHGGRRDGDLFNARIATATVARARADLVVHAAGTTHGTRDELWRANLLMVARLLDAVADTGNRTRVVLIGSAAEYGLTDPGTRLDESSPCRPNSEYGMSKLAATRLAQAETRIAVRVGRLFNVVSDPHPSRSLLGRVAQGYREGQASPDGAGEVRDFIPIEAVARSLIGLATATFAPAVVNICTGVPRTAAQQLGRARPGVPDSEGMWSVGDPTALGEVLGDRRNSADAMGSGTRIP